MTTQKPPREVGANDAQYGQPTSLTLRGNLAPWVIPITCGHCHAIIRATRSGTNWEDLECGDTCPGGQSHEPASTPPISHIDQETPNQ
jgi:hypothetical protein